MKKRALCLILIVCILLLSACDIGSIGLQQSTQATQVTHPQQTLPPVTDPPATEPPVTEPPVTEPPVTEPPHSQLYVPGVSVEDMIRYFNEVCLDAEYSSGPGNASLIQKWDIPIYYMLTGSATDADLQVLTGFVTWLNTIEGFPGIHETEDAAKANLKIYFCTKQELIDRMGANLRDADGAVTFWYNDNKIFDEVICYRTDIDQTVRNSVILEEIYNGLGPAQDTDLRRYSIIYSGFSQPQQLTKVDEAILKLLYHPDILPGMNAAECEAVIRQLYY